MHYEQIFSILSNSFVFIKIIYNVFNKFLLCKIANNLSINWHKIKIKLKLIHLYKLYFLLLLLLNKTKVFNEHFNKRRELLQN